MSMQEYHDSPESRKGISLTWKKARRVLADRYGTKIPLRLCKAASLYYWIWKSQGRFTLTDPEIAKSQGCDEATAKRRLAELRQAKFLESKTEWSPWKWKHIRTLIPHFEASVGPVQTLEALALALGVITPPLPPTDGGKSPAPPSPKPSEKSNIVEEAARIGVAAGMIFGAIKKYGAEVVRTAVAGVRQQVRKGNARNPAMLFWAFCKNGWGPNDFEATARRAPSVVSANDDAGYVARRKREDDLEKRRAQEKIDKVKRVLFSLAPLDQRELLKRARQSLLDSCTGVATRKLMERKTIDDPLVFTELGKMIQSGAIVIPG